MSLTQLTFTYTGGPQVFSTNFALGVLETDHIFVSVDGNVDGQGNQVFSSFTYDENTGNLTITDALTEGDTGTIARLVPVDALITDFEQGSDVTRRNLNRMAKQILMSAQQTKDQSDADNERVDGIVDDVLLATDQADLSAQDAAGSAAQANQYKIAAGVSANNANNAAVAASTSASKSEEWAQNPEDVPVKTGPDQFSALHWATKASDVVAAITLPLPVTSGGTGAENAENARTNLGLGTIATQNANDISITGGTINGVQITGLADGVAPNDPATVGQLPTALSPTELSQGQATDPDDINFGTVNGALLADAFDAREQQIGVGQTPTDVSASRDGGTVYQNTTGKPITGYLSGSTNTARDVQVSLDGSTNWIRVARITSAATFGISFIVPADWYYRVDGSIQTPTNTTWVELR